jgi:hypothetical protein
VGDAGEGAADTVRIHDDGHAVTSSRPLWVALKSSSEYTVERAFRAVPAALW